MAAQILPGGAIWGGAVPPLKCITLYKQQTPQQHAVETYPKASDAGIRNILTRRGGYNCAGDAAFRQNSFDAAAARDDDADVGGDVGSSHEHLSAADEQQSQASSADNAATAA